MARWLLPVVLLAASAGGARERGHPVGGPSWRVTRVEGKVVKRSAHQRLAFSHRARLSPSAAARAGTTRRPLPRHAARLRFRAVSRRAGAARGRSGAAQRRRSSGPHPRLPDHRAQARAAGRRGRTLAVLSAARRAGGRRERGREGASTRVRAPSSPTSTFQIGASALTRSISARAPANASPRCGALAATITLGSRERHAADAVLERDRAQPVALGLLLADRAQLRLAPSRRRPRSRAASTSRVTPSKHTTAPAARVADRGGERAEVQRLGR